MSDLEITKRGPGRPPNPRPAMDGAPGTDDSKARAEARLREIRGQANAGSGDRDKFWAPNPPDGWDYQWKRKTVFGQEDPSYQVELMRQGWEPVPLSRHPDMMPAGWRGEFIEVEGQVLMERPAVLTKEARLRDDAAAREAVRSKEAQLGLANKGDLSRDGRRDVKLSRSYESMPVPADE